MNHAKKISRADKTAQDNGADYALLRTGQVFKLDETAKRSGRTAKGQEKVCTTNNATDAFLNSRFYTRLLETTVVADCNKDKLEKDFYKSLSIISEKFGISTIATNDIPYPSNISVSLADLKKQLKIITSDWREVRLIHNNGSTYFAKENRYDTGMTLYYIPVIPLYTILQRKETEKAGLLLLSVYAYLYHVLKIPYYREQGCYLHSTYEVLEEWAENDGADKETFRQIKEAKVIGDLVKGLLCNPEHLKSFGKRVRTFKPKSAFDKSCLLLAKRFYAIYRKYRKTPIDRNYYPMIYREETEDGRAVMLDDYVSFCASLKGELFNELIQTANNELQEYSSIDEPVIFTPYHSTEKTAENFDFERDVFGRLNDIIILWQESQF